MIIHIMARKRNTKRRPSRRYEEEEELEDTGSNTGRGVAVILLWIAGLLSALSFFDLAGQAGIYILDGLVLAFGWGKFVFPLILFGLGFAYLQPQKYRVRWINYVGLGLFLISFMSFLELLGADGGLIGFLVGAPLVSLLGALASFFVFLAVIVASVLITFQAALEDLLRLLKRAFSPAARALLLSRHGGSQEEEYEEEDEDDEDEEEEEDDDEPEFDSKEVREEMKKSEAKSKVQKELPVVGKRSVKPYQGVPMSLLSKASSKPLSGDTKKIEQVIVDTLGNFGIPALVDEISVGPTVTQYALRPTEPIKLSRVTSLNNELALALAAHPIRIEAPIPGKSLVGVEVPNKSVAKVCLREVIDSDNFKRTNGNLCMSLGKDVSGKVWVGNLETMPHCLIAGATGSGKTVCINTVIMSLLFQYSPEELKFILVDPKRVELPQYNGIPHLMTPVITDVDQTINALKWGIHEMERRFNALSAAGKRNIQSYNKTAEEPMPYIVIVIDELADLMATSAREVEAAIIRLAQMARAVGIHLVVATQRPSVDVITGLIKANIPTRIAFSVASIVDSRTILDTAGAEKLLGRGDMLYFSSDLGSPKRLQGAFVSDDEIAAVVKHLKKLGEPEYTEDITQKQAGVGSGVLGGGDDDDPLLQDAKQVVFDAGKASASLLQRRLRVGYARAARLIDLLEAHGIVGPQDGAKPRAVLIDSMDASPMYDEAPEEPPVPQGDDDEEEYLEPEEEEDELEDDEDDEEEDDDEEEEEEDEDEELDEDEFEDAQKGEYLEDDDEEKK